MAAPIAHIFLALQMLAGPLNGLFNVQEFIVGTSFPDIRYMKIGVKRTQTHVANVTLEDIKSETNSFRAGLLFHSFVDEVRERYVEEQGLYRRMPNFRFKAQALKFAEDKILRDQFNAMLYQHHFRTILPEEKEFNIPERHILRWHDFLKNYCSNNATLEQQFTSFFDLHEPNAWRIKRFLFVKYYVPKFRQAVQAILRDDQARATILNFYQNFVQMVEGVEISSSTSDYSDDDIVLKQVSIAST